MIIAVGLPIIAGAVGYIIGPPIMKAVLPSTASFSNTSVGTWLARGGTAVVAYVVLRKVL